MIGAYEYRLGNLPAFVPPGHGLVYLAGLRISQCELVRQHRRAFLGVVIAIVAAWGLAGLALLGRADVLGAVCAALLIYVLAGGRAPTLYAGVFIMVALLELYGTAIGSWTWAGAVPGTPVPSGNPPERHRGRVRAVRHRRDRARAAAPFRGRGVSAPAPAARRVAPAPETLREREWWSGGLP